MDFEPNSNQLVTGITSIGSLVQGITGVADPNDSWYVVKAFESTLHGADLTGVSELLVVDATPEG
eukprot:452856-Amphidinium_carterae.1